MSETAVIDRFTVRWVVEGTGSPDTVDPARLDALVAALLDGPLEDALVGCGVGRDEEVCLRQVAVPPVTMRWDRPDTVVLDAWSRAIGAAVHDAIAAAGGGQDDDRDVVHYPSAAHARMDMVVRAAVGDRGRVWAWRRLGLWPADLPDSDPGVPAEHVLGVLDDHPTLIVPVFVRLARRAALGRAAAALGAAALVQLAERAWRAAGGTSPLLPPRLPGRPRFPDPAGPTPASAGPDRPSGGAAPAGTPGRPEKAAAAAARLVAHSRIAATVAAGPRWAPEVRLAWAALAVLEAEPAVARSGYGGSVEVSGPIGAGLVGAVADVVDGSAPGTPAPVRPVAADQCPSGRPATPDRAWEEAGAAAEPAAPPGTAWAGLLFVLNVLDDLDVPRTLAGQEAAAARGVRSALHALGTALVRRCQEPGEPPVAATDPALLAFCGLPPDADPPGPEDEHPAVVAAAREVAAEVVRRLGRPVLDPDAEPPDAALAHVCRRRGVIVADPGWFDVRLDLDGVSTDVRRAGLDLDPGHLWWLGAVVRFRYG